LEFGGWRRIGVRRKVVDLCREGRTQVAGPGANLGNSERLRELIDLRIRQAINGGKAGPSGARSCQAEPISSGARKAGVDGMIGARRTIDVRRIGVGALAVEGNIAAHEMARIRQRHEPLRAGRSCGRIKLCFYLKINIADLLHNLYAVVSRGVGIMSRSAWNRDL
jgi:hypothetical protein